MINGVEMIPTFDPKRGYYVDFIKNGVPLFIICFTKKMELFNILPSDRIIDYNSNVVKNAEEYTGIRLKNFTNKKGITYKVMDCEEVLLKDLIKVSQDRIRAIYGGEKYNTSLTNSTNEIEQPSQVSNLKESKSFRN